MLLKMCVSVLILQITRKSTNAIFATPGPAVNTSDFSDFKALHDTNYGSRSVDIISYLGCFSVWEKQYTKLTPVDFRNPFNQANGISECAEKCLENDKSSLAQLVFIRGVECHCASTDFRFNATHLSDDFCNYHCPQITFPNKFKFAPNTCGGNLAYSVYCTAITATSSGCNIIVPPIKQDDSLKEKSALAPRNEYPKPIRDSVHDCALCPADSEFPCTPLSISPQFDYFPLNSAQDCADFCNLNINYVQWNEDGDEELTVRFATLYAILLWWNNDKLTLPICLCGDEDAKEKLKKSPGYCRPCPTNTEEWCGGYSDTGGVEVFASVYCIDDGSGRCPGSSPSTPTTSTTTSTTTTARTTTTTERADQQSTRGDLSTTDIYSSSSRAGFQTTSTFRTTTFFTTPEMTTTLRTTAPTDSLHSPKYCRCTDRNGYTWHSRVNKTQAVLCSKLIPNSVGTAFWKCNEHGHFEPSHPDLSECKSKWVLEKESDLENIRDLQEAINLTVNLSKGCIESHEKERYKYFGHEIAKLSTIMNETLVKVREFDSEPSSEQFEDLVTEAVELNACLINSPDPWEDLSLNFKANLSTQLMEATEDVLFHLTEFVEPKPEYRYRKMFIPNQQFTAAAETFDKRTGVFPNETYEFPPKRNPDRESCIKLPVGWTGLLTGNKIEIAVITIAPESVAKVMTGERVYEVNGLPNKIINGRMISLSVTSSNEQRNFRSNFQSIRSKTLIFDGDGVKITFHHIVDAWGEQAYDISRKLHEGERPKAVLGSAECMFWDTKTNLWSPRGCKVVKNDRIETVCECSHLTSFALLMGVHSYIGKNRGLTILTLILCPLSELALLLTIGILSVIGNSAYKSRSTICKHLSFCLFLGNGMILIVLDRNYFNLTEGVCMGAAMATHYVFLCAFMWMLFEGVQLYRMVVNVFDSGRSYMRHFGIIAYGSPLIIIALTAAVGYIKKDRPYGGDAYCWLIGNYIWSFMIPVAIVITVNLTILFIALKTAYQLQHQGQREKKLSSTLIIEKIRSYRIYFKGCFSLTVILGITWVLGFFTLMEGSSKVIAAYLFTILNASQGFFIFLFTCRIYISQLRLFTQRKLSSYFPSLLMNSSSNHSSIIIRNPNVIPTHSDQPSYFIGDCPLFRPPK